MRLVWLPNTLGCMARMWLRVALFMLNTLELGRLGKTLGCIACMKFHSLRVGVASRDTFDTFDALETCRGW